MGGLHKKSHPIMTWPIAPQCTAPFKGPRLASCVASRTTEKQGHRQVCPAMRGGPRTPSTTTDANLDCAFVENALFTLILNCEKSTEYN